MCLVPRHIASRLAKLAGSRASPPSSVEGKQPRPQLWGHSYYHRGSDVDYALRLALPPLPWRALFLDCASLTIRPLFLWDLSWPGLLGRNLFSLFNAERGAVDLAAWRLVLAAFFLALASGCVWKYLADLDLPLVDPVSLFARCGNVFPLVMGRSLLSLRA